MKKPIGFKPSEISALINEQVVQQHADEASFQWLLRNAAVTSPNYNLMDLAALDERVEANIDGLRVAGEYGWKICEEQLGFEEPGEVFTAGVLSVESGDDEGIKRVLDVALKEKALLKAFISALGWIGFDQAEPAMTKLIASDIPEHRYVGIAAYAIHRQDPGPVLTQAVHDQAPIVRARALKAAGELGRLDLMNDLIHYAHDDHEMCRFYAAWSAARLGNCMENIVTVLCDFIVPADPKAPQALPLVLNCMQDEQALRFFQKLKASVEHQRLAAIAIGLMGDPALIPELFPMMNRQDLARVAGESFSMITGIDIEYDDLNQDPPEGFEAGISEDPDAQDVEMDPDEDLPWPNPALIGKWWQAHQKKFKPGKRYLLGQLINEQSLNEVLRIGNQRQRLVAALELSIRNTGNELFEVRAPGKRQIRLLNI